MNTINCFICIEIQKNFEAFNIINKTTQSTCIQRKLRIAQHLAYVGVDGENVSRVGGLGSLTGPGDRRTQVTPPAARTNGLSGSHSNIEESRNLTRNSTLVHQQCTVRDSLQIIQKNR